LYIDPECSGPCEFTIDFYIHNYNTRKYVGFIFAMGYHLYRFEGKITDIDSPQINLHVKCKPNQNPSSFFFFLFLFLWKLTVFLKNLYGNEKDQECYLEELQNQRTYTTTNLTYLKYKMSL
jgi:hypothetical protein